MFKTSYSLDFLNNVSFVNVHHTLSIRSTIFCKQPSTVPAGIISPRARNGHKNFNNILKLATVEAFLTQDCTNQNSTSLRFICSHSPPPLARYSTTVIARQYSCVAYAA